ncbi:hypothetical protein LTR48_003095 [Friedmanniomyces endolithicus]|nr:hypothetical protein LTR48_003095 [Friedmanniomyces endolithicus]KAK5145445.1 hypothetical protein LTR32_002791 [Rachicladosporium monterosium]
MPHQAGTRDTTEVDRLLQELERNLEGARSSLREQETLLARLKVCSRDAKTARPMFTEKGIEILSKYGLNNHTLSTSHEALRCLANVLLLNESSRQIFADLGFVSKAAERLKSENRDDEFLISRTLLLLTYKTNVNFEELTERHDLTGSINEHIARHAKHLDKKGRSESQSGPMEEAAMVETLKLMFNITHYYPSLIARFQPAIEPLIDLLLHSPLPTTPLQPPITYIINALLNLDLAPASQSSEPSSEVVTSPLFPPANQTKVVDRMIFIFNGALKDTPDRDLDAAAAPLCTLLRRAYELADLETKAWMRRKLLPHEEDRNQPLGKGESLSSRLLRLSCSPGLPTLRENVSCLLFELSDKDADTFVRNIGYGYASGFLASHGIEFLGNATGARNLGSEVETSINPVTGQRLSAEEGRDGSGGQEMSEEEKEREAERLFVLFERLRATGVVDVVNPVQKAVDEGRFEEVP